MNFFLGISFESEPDCVVLCLSNPSGTVVHRQEVGTNTTNRAYHRREALVIGMRQLVSKAIDQNLISVSLGAWKTSNIASQESGTSTMSSTDWGF